MMFFLGFLSGFVVIAGLLVVDALLDGSEFPYRNSQGGSA